MLNIIIRQMIKDVEDDLNSKSSKSGAIREVAEDVQFNQSLVSDPVLKPEFISFPT